ncbi:hypothetical protein V499_08929 [Pseudogymnoascus sp. VKM F-103]|nr:hypothetical protein V499_08929 [Pseudogymnoascus sp. VKM F-103]
MPSRYLEPDGSPPSYRAPSFTPVNQPVQSGWGKNSDALYDIPQDDDPLPVSQLPQKRKRQSTVSTRNKSAPAVHMKKPRRKDDSPLSKRFAYIPTPDKHNLSQPSLPHGAKKSASRRTNSALSKQTKVFPNTSISKPNAQRPYDEAHLKKSTEFTINAPSTLDKIAQAGHIGLGQTTLEKLAAFRFKTPAVNAELDQATLDQAMSLNRPTDTANLETHLFAHEQSIRNGKNDNYTLPAPEDALSPVEHEVYADVSHQTPHALATSGEPEDDFDDLFAESANFSCSTEARAYVKNYGSVSNSIPQQDHSESFEVSSSIYRDSAFGTEMNNSSNIRRHEASCEGWDEGLDDEDFAQFNIDDLALPNILPTPRTLPHKASVHFPAEHGSDDFDDGVADDDLMEIMAEHENVHNYARHQATTSPDNGVKSSARFKNASRSSSRLQSTHDEYFMDDTDEAELANLAEQDNPVIVETHSSPSNWTESDVRSRDREVYDEKLTYSSPSIKHSDNIINSNQLRVQPSVESLAEPEDWSFLNHNPAVPKNIESLRNNAPQTALPMTPGPSGPSSANDDSHEYIPLTPFARSPFPEKVSNCSVIPGLTTCTILRTCFRIGECIRAGSFCNRLNQDAIIELFCRVTFSSREDGTHKQIFQFADVFHNSPPFVNGVLANYLVSALQERESRELLTGNCEEPGMQNSTASNSSLQQQASHWPPVGDRIQHSETPISHNHTPSAGIATGTISPLEPMLEVATQATPFTYTRFSTAVDLIYSIPSALSVAPVMAPKPELYLKAVRHEMCQERPLGGKACD